MSYPIYFSLVGTAGAALRLEEVLRAKGDRVGLQWLHRVAAVIGLVAAGLVFTGLLGDRYALYRPAWNKNQIAFDRLRRGAEGIYFPDHPLAHVMAEGKLYHLAQAVYDREVRATFPVSDEHFYQHVPDNLSMICGAYPFDFKAEWLRERRLADLTEETALEGTEVFKCYQRPRLQ